MKVKLSDNFKKEDFIIWIILIIFILLIGTIWSLNKTQRISGIEILDTINYNTDKDYIEFNIPISRSYDLRQCIPGGGVNKKLNCLPSIISPGVQKCGTSFIYMYLIKHPNIGKSSVKELNYFLSYAYPHGIESYTQNLIDDSLQLPVDFSPKYMMVSESAELIYKTNRNQRFIIILRDPVDRAYSHYQFQKKLYYSPNSMQHTLNSSCPHRRDITFKQYISEEFNILRQCNMLTDFQPLNPSWLTTDTMTKECRTWNCFYNNPERPCLSCFQLRDVQVTGDVSLGYLSHGIYYSHIEHYFKYFPRDNFLFIRYEDLQERGEITVLNEIISWLGLENISDDLWGPISVINPNDYPPINPDEEQFLSEFYRKPNQKLYNLLGRDMKWK